MASADGCIELGLSGKAGKVVTPAFVLSICRWLAALEWHSGSAEPTPNRAEKKRLKLHYATQPVNALAFQNPTWTAKSGIVIYTDKQTEIVDPPKMVLNLTCGSATRKRTPTKWCARTRNPSQVTHTPLNLASTDNSDNLR